MRQCRNNQSQNEAVCVMVQYVLTVQSAAVPATRREKETRLGWLAATDNHPRFGLHGDPGASRRRIALRRLIFQHMQVINSRLPACFSSVTSTEAIDR